MLFPEPGIGSASSPPASPSSSPSTTGRGRRRARRGAGRIGLGRPGEIGSGSRSRRTRSSPGSAWSPATELAEAAGLEGETESSSTSTGARAAARTFSPPATSPASRSALSADDADRARGSCEHARPARSARTWPAPQPYDHLPFFYSDLFDLGYEAVGQVDSRLESGRELAGAEPQGSRHVRRGRPAARRAALERLGQARRGARADPRGRGGPCRLAPSPGRASRGAGRARVRAGLPARSRIRSSSSRTLACAAARCGPRRGGGGVRGGDRARHTARFARGALLVQLKTLLDNADGQLARLTRRVSAFGRYLDSEVDLLVNAALFAALGGDRTAGARARGLLALTSVLSLNFNVERLSRRQPPSRRRPGACDAASCAASTASSTRRRTGWRKRSSPAAGAHGPSRRLGARQSRHVDAARRVWALDRHSDNPLVVAWLVLGRSP